MLRPRTMGIMDLINNIGGDLLTPPQASPVESGRNPLQMMMARPEVQVSQPRGTVMSTTMPDGTIATASTTPQVQQQFGMPQSRGMPTPPQVAPARPQIPDMGGAGVRLPPEQLAEQAARAKQLEETRPELKTDPDFQNRLSGFFGNRENMLRLAAGFNSMRLRPDTGLATIINQELTDIRSKRTETEERNRTAEYFDTVDPKISAAIRNGLSAKDAITLFREKQKGVVVGKMIVNPSTGKVIYDGSGEAEGLPATFRALQERAKAAGLQPGTEEYSQFMLNGGQRAGLSIKTNPDGTFEITEGGALSVPKLSEAQTNAVSYGGRMMEDNKILSDLDGQGTDFYQGLVGQLPMGLGNYLQTPEYQRYSQAKRSFINAILRKESGAAIAESEFANAERQYFPQPGDSPEVIEQKRKNRELATTLMTSGVPIESLTTDVRQVLNSQSQAVERPASVPAEVWDNMPPEDRILFKK